VLALKGNHETLHRQAVLLTEADEKPGRFKAQTRGTDEQSRGRHEVRTYTTVPLNAKTTHRIAKGHWPGLCAVGRVVAERTVKGQTTAESRYYLLSDGDVERFAQAVRGHWGIENAAHWVLDVTFDEDAHRVSKDHAPENPAILRRLAMNLFRANRQRSGIALKNQRKMVGWNPDFITELIQHAF
jgi:predicted transposase YbfD/YdcC